MGTALLGFAITWFGVSVSTENTPRPVATAVHFQVAVSAPVDECYASSQVPLATVASYT